MIKLKKLLNETRTRVTKTIWDKLSDDDRETALLTALKDPDDMFNHVGDDWNELPSIVRANMVIYK